MDSRMAEEARMRMERRLLKAADRGGHCVSEPKTAFMQRLHPGLKAR
jgi:hypothetical protein